MIPPFVFPPAFYPMLFLFAVFSWMLEVQKCDPIVRDSSGRTPLALCVKQLDMAVATRNAEAVEAHLQAMHLLMDKGAVVQEVQDVGHLHTLVSPRLKIRRHSSNSPRYCCRWKYY